MSKPRTSIAIPDYKNGTLDTHGIGAWPFPDDTTSQAQRLRRAYDRIHEIAAARNEAFAKAQAGRGAGEDVRPWKERMVAPELTILNAQRKAADDLKAIRAARAAAADMFDEMVERRVCLKPFEVEPANIAAAMRRQSIRDAVARMDAKDRKAFLDSSVGNDDVAAAILEVPAGVSGLPGAVWERFQNSAMRHRHGDELDFLSQIERAIEMVDRAADVAREGVKRSSISELGMRPDEFREFAAEVEG